MKDFQLHHAPGSGVIERNVAAFDRMMDRSDPEVIRHYNKAYQRRLDNARIPYTPEVIALCCPEFLGSENSSEKLNDNQIRESNRGMWNQTFNVSKLLITSVMAKILFSTNSHYLLNFSVYLL